VGTPRDTTLDLVWYLFGDRRDLHPDAGLQQHERQRFSQYWCTRSFDVFFVERLFLAPIAASNMGSTIGFGALALLIVVFTRGRLGYDRYRREDPDPAPAPTGG